MALPWVSWPISLTLQQICHWQWIEVDFFHVTMVRCLQSWLWMHPRQRKRDECVCPAWSWASTHHLGRIHAALWSRCSWDTAVLMLEYLDLWKRFGCHSVGFPSKITPKLFGWWDKLKAWFTGKHLLWIWAKEVRQPDLVVILACALPLHLLEAGRLLLRCWDTGKPAGNLSCKLGDSCKLCPF